MTGLPEFNYPAFNAAAAQLRAAGFHVENPAENPVPECKSWQGYMRLAVIQLATCDRIVTLPGWQDSRGARVEVDLGIALGMDVVDLDYLLTLPPVVTGGSAA
jgi:hypothetical protein